MAKSIDSKQPATTGHDGRHPQNTARPPTERPLLQPPQTSATTTTLQLPGGGGGGAAAAAERRPSTFVVDAGGLGAGFLQRSQSRVSERMRSLRANITIEPLLAFYIVPCVFVGLAVQNLNLEKACRVNMGYEAHVCDALTARDTANYTQEEQAVQKLVAGMTSWKTILQSGLPGMMILFWGSWSDRYVQWTQIKIFAD